MIKINEFENVDDLLLITHEHLRIRATEGVALRKILEERKYDAIVKHLDKIQSAISRALLEVDNEIAKQEED